MVGLLWLLAAAGVLGDSYSLTDWTTFLKSINSSLPLTTAEGNEICYYFDISQACADQAAGDLLSLPAIENITTWGPTPAQCDSLLDGQRLYAEKLASSVFSAAIASAAIAGVAEFELLAQSWMLRVGHHPLINMYPGFVEALNNISDWTNVQCDGANLLYDSATMAQPDFFSKKDCEVLYLQTYICGNSTCPFSDANECCLADMQYGCCQTHYADLLTACSGIGCPYQEFCCMEANTTSCCPPSG